MIVTVRFFTTLREITQKRKKEIELASDAMVEDLISLLSKKYGRRFASYVYDEKGGEVSPPISCEWEGHNWTTRP